MLRPVILLTIDIAIPDKPTRGLTCFETNALSCHDAAVGTADVNHHILVHPHHSIQHAFFGGLDIKHNEKK